MTSNFNRSNDGTPKRSKINIERNDLSDKSNGEDGFAMPDPEDDFWKPVIPGSESPDEGKTDFLYGDGAGCKIASACARIKQMSGHEQNLRYQQSKLPTSNDDYVTKDSRFDFDEPWSKQEPSFSQRRRNPSFEEDVDLLSFDDPTFKLPVLTPIQLPIHAPEEVNRYHRKQSGGEDDQERRSRNASASPEFGAVGGACAAASASASSSNFDVLESSRKMLYEMFSHVPTHRIDKILEECDGSVTRCTDLLLDYPQQPEPLTTVKHFPISSQPREEKEFRTDIPLFGQKKNRNRNLSGPSSQNKTVVSGFVNPEHPEFGGIYPNSMRHSQTNYKLNEPELEESPSGGTPKTPSNPSKFLSPVDSENYSTLEDSDLYVPIDGEDWFDFQLTPDFVRDLFNAYSEPGRLTVAEMTPDSPELKIRIPPKLAFKLYQMLALSMMQRSVDRERADYLSAANNDWSDDETKSPSPDNSEPDSDLKKFLREEMKLTLRELQCIRVRRDHIQNEMALKLTLAKLRAVFPTASEIVIEEAFDRNGSRFEDTVRTLRPMYGNKLEPAGLEEDFPGNEEIIAETIKQELEVLCDLSAKCGAEELRPESELTAEEWRNKATKHHVLRSQYQKKGQLMARQGLSGSLIYYSRMYNLHTDRMLEANGRAASIIMLEFKRRHGKQNILDLHHLYVAEAVDALHNHLTDCADAMRAKGIKKMEIRVITGRGNNSTLGVPRIAPAVVAYLRSHHYSFLELAGSVVVTLKAKENKFQY